MEITHRSVDGIDVITLDGRFDAYEVPSVVKWLDAHPQARYVVVNLQGVGFIDSSGLSTLVKGLKRCRQNEGELYLCHLIFAQMERVSILSCKWKAFLIGFHAPKGIKTGIMAKLHLS